MITSLLSARVRRGGVVTKSEVTSHKSERRDQDLGNRTWLDLGDLVAIA